jgi:hypothetical protein
MADREEPGIPAMAAALGWPLAGQAVITDSNYTLTNPDGRARVLKKTEISG